MIRPLAVHSVDVRRRLAAGVLFIAIVGGCGAPDEQVTSASTTTDAPAEGWEQLPPSPLAPRGGAVLVTLEGGRLLVVGGDAMAGCRDHRTPPEDATPGQASAASARPLIVRAALSCAPMQEDPRFTDGAILESPRGPWKRIAAAPAPLSAPSRGVVLGDSVYFWAWPSSATGGPQEPTWMVYNVVQDRWTKLAAPPVSTLRIVNAGDRIVGFHGSEESGPVTDFLYDPGTDSWAELPRDPLSPSFDRFMVWTGVEVVLLANELVPNPGSERPSLVRAAAFDPGTKQWRRLPDSEIVGGYDTWWWSGAKVVNAVRHTSDGGEMKNWGRDYPHGGVFDPAAGEWRALPPGRPPTPDCAKEKQSWDANLGYQAAGPEIVVSGDLALDLSANSWHAVPCNPHRADFNFTSTWAFDGVVAFGGYDEVDEIGQFPEKYEFSNAAWLWRPGG